MKLKYLLQGLPGHPIHPPLTDATIGTYTFATAAATLQVLGLVEENGARGWWIALIIGLVFGGVTAVTGFIDWLDITKGTPLWRTATSHMIAMLSATVFFALAAIFGHSHYRDFEIGTWPYIFTLAGFGLLSLGGWLGGAVVYVHGMRVLNLVEEPARRAAAPYPHPEKEMAEGGER